MADVLYDIHTEPEQAPVSTVTAPNRVPLPTWDFWVVKLLAVTVGETGADFIAQNLGFGLPATTIMMSAILVMVLGWQFGQKRYVPPIYWLAVVFVSIVGTLITDYLVDEAGVSLELCSFVFASALAATFATWYAMEKTLSIHDVTTTRREAFYWLAILLTFALGTAAGDLLAEGAGMGYLTAGILYTAVVAAVFIAWKRFGMNGILAFWLAYIVTRPAGASFGDLLSQPVANGGLGFGTTITSAVFLITIAAVIYWMTQHKDHLQE
ncbi:MAG: hypothetical protein OXR62_03315 [Ahrensia sp.]|nr:hypothetical protein [Ahrensia sp.]